MVDVNHRALDTGSSNVNAQDLHQVPPAQRAATSKSHGQYTLGERSVNHTSPGGFEAALSMYGRLPDARYGIWRNHQPTLVRGGFAIHRQTAGYAIQRARGGLVTLFCFEISPVVLGPGGQGRQGRAGLTAARVEIPGLSVLWRDRRRLSAPSIYGILDGAQPQMLLYTNNRRDNTGGRSL